jgi:hypothetical protein
VETVEVEGDETTVVDLSLRPVTNVGALDVRVKPDDSLVELDRLPVGRTPALVLNVPAGTHTVEVSAEGHRPLMLTVTVAPDQRRIVDGRLLPVDDESGPSADGDLSSLGKLAPEDIPPLADLAEGRAFQPVRDRLSRRDYDGALEALDALAEDPSAQQYALRIGRERRIVRRIREVAEAAYRELARAVGQDYVLVLRGGIRLSGRLVEVADGHLTVAMPAGERRIDLADVAGTQVERLASAEFDPGEPGHLVSFALLYAAEGEFEESYACLRRAASSGYSIASARSYVDAEHIWHAAVDKDKRDRRARAMADVGPNFPRLQDRGPVQFLVDLYRGQGLPDDLRRILSDNGVAPARLTGTFGPEAAEEPAVLIIFDRGGADPVPRYDRQELQLILDFVQRGGALLFIGAPRPVGPRQSGATASLRPHPFDPLLRWYGIMVRRNRTELVDDAPDGYPEQYAIGVPVPAHPVAAGASSYITPMGGPTLTVQNAGWTVVRADGFVTSSPDGLAAPVLVAARVVGDGRIAVMSSWPQTAASRRPGTPLFGNNSEVLARNVLAWLAQAPYEAALRASR